MALWYWALYKTHGQTRSDKSMPYHGRFLKGPALDQRSAYVCAHVHTHVYVHVCAHMLEPRCAEQLSMNELHTVLSDLGIDEESIEEIVLNAATPRARGLGA